jgi:anti-sigma factor RsiW
MSANMRGRVPITDEELVAYLDGAINPMRRSAIDATLAHDRSLGIRLAHLDIDKNALRAAFDAVAAAAPVDRLRAQFDRPFAPPRRQRDSARWAAIAAALVLAAALGYDLGSGDLVGSASDWHVAIADYQSLYTAETLAPIASDPAKQRRDVADITRKLGLPIAFEALQVPGLDFKRAQLLAFEGRPLVQFAYLDPAGIPVAFCATRSGDADSPIRTGRFHGLDAAFWTRNGYGFIVIGATQAETLQKAAALLAQQI